MIISSAIITYKSGQKDQAEYTISCTPETSVVQHFDENRIGILIETSTTDQTMAVSKQLLSSSAIVSYDIAYFSTELETENEGVHNGLKS